MTGELIGGILSLIIIVGFGVAGALSVLIWKKNRVSRVSFLRFIIQAVGSATLFYIFSIKPSIPLLYIFITWFAATLVLGRFFCGWVCPFAFIMDLESVVRKTLKIRYRILPDKLNIALHKSRYIILTIFLFLPIILWTLNPPPDMNANIIMLQQFAGPFRSYSFIVEPLTPFIVPWTGHITLGNINLSYPYLSNITSLIETIPGQIFALLFVCVTLAGAFLVRRVWCRFCPTGASLAALNQFKIFKKLPLLHIEKDEKKCTRCGICKRVCLVQVNEVYEQKGGEIRTSQCMLCTRCVEMCPYDDALKVKIGKKTVFNSRNWLEPSIISDEKNKQQNSINN
ncbi:MAG: 4Fe-4S binding protein [Nitrososphaerota archaeon]|jgi:polyferredoxin|nr:4Fe-4S binding protein [Nitrososphaerota archaeon]